MIDLEIRSPVATATLNRPPVNAIDHDWVRELDEIVQELEGREDIPVLHIRSSGKAFCAGADLALMRELMESPAGCDAMVELIRQYQAVLVKLEQSSLVTVAEIGGAALGGGFELALACDLRVAAKSAKLGLPEAGLGLIPGAGGTQRLTRICGEAVARRIILGAEVVSGEQAQPLGMVHWSVDADELQAWSAALVNRLGSLPRQALASCKQCIAASFEQGIDGYELELQETRRLYAHPDTRQRVHAFLHKRG